MKLAIVLLACLGLAAAASIVTKPKVTIADKTFLEKQKFLFEIVYRVEDPLMFEEWIKYGEKFIYDKSHYTHFDVHMEKFYEAYKMGALLPKGEFFGALVKTHHKQAWGLFNFLYHAKDWETFLHNVCWARIHVNEGMFVYALNLAVIHREDFKGLIMPSIYEIFPQYFLNSKFIYEAEKFDFSTWSKYSMYEKEFYDVYYKNNKYYNQDYFYVKDFKTWQWWKLMGLGEHWFSGEKGFPLRENIYEFNSDGKWNELMKDVQWWWMPVDYTRDVKYFNDETKLSYFTEDLGWNSYWYYLNMDYSFFLDGKTFGLNKDRRGEWWIYNVQQLLARYYMERLSHGYGEIPQLSFYQDIEHGYDPELIAYNGVGFSYRKDYFNYQTYGNFELLNHIQGALMRINNIIETGYYMTADGVKIDMRDAKAIEHVGNWMQGNMDVFDKYFFNYWNMLTHMYIADVDYYTYDVTPNVFLNFETMMRDPMFYSVYRKIAEVFYHFKYQFEPYTQKDLMFEGVKLVDVETSDLVTYFDLFDIDVTNLMNDKMVFADGKFVWDKTLLGRQMRLNHKPFTFDITIEADKAQKVVIRSFIAPKINEHGRIFSMKESRENWMELDEFVYELASGKNVIHRKSDDFYWTMKDRTTYTEMYHYIMAAWEGKYEFPLDISEPHCNFPDRLILPKGWVKGMPMQMFFFVAPYESTEEFLTYDWTYDCGIGSGARHVDNKPFGYPFDREIDEFEFLVPNMYFKDVMIYHYNTMEKYYEEYKNFGHFDYTFFKDYYTKYFK